MAKFFIHTNLMCRKPRAAKPARARSRRTFARARRELRLARAAAKRQEDVAYRKNIGAKQRTADPFHPRGHYQYAGRASRAKPLRERDDVARMGPSDDYDESGLTAHAARHRAEWKTFASASCTDARLRPSGPHRWFEYRLRRSLSLIAPPRMGKKALIWLMTSFGVKLGGTVFVGVAPHKRIPMDEMLGKAGPAAGGLLERAA